MLSLKSLSVVTLTCLLKLALLVYVRVKHADTEYKISPFMTLPLRQALQPVRMNMEDTIRYRVERSPLTDAEWEALVPGDGLVYLGPSKMPYTVSIFHQLRCLDIIRREIHEKDSGVKSNRKEPSELGHHCLNYLRQMVLCRGDIHLDPVFGNPKQSVVPDVYECLDWNAVYESVKENQRRV